ncbi:Lsr2 family protein [Kineococcus gynurae]|uniref:Lsr2 family protein n=1 Tax=Kineococcus gynurae TaxID=452979 RepID=A0ABV5LTU2_9ACTN
MAQKVQVLLVDDIDGGDADETLTFALDGVNYEIDLSEEHATALREALGHWVGHARKVGGRGAARRPAPAPRAARPAGSDNDTGAVRAWAKEQGLKVSDRGRISAEVLQAYAAAH